MEGNRVHRWQKQDNGNSRTLPKMCHTERLQLCQHATEEHFMASGPAALALVGVDTGTGIVSKLHALGRL